MTVRSVTLVCAFLLIASGCGDEPAADVTATGPATAAPTTGPVAPPTAPIGPACAKGAAVPAADVEALAGRLLTAPIHAMVDRAQFTSSESIRASGIDLRLGEVVRAELIESAPLNILPAEDQDDPPTNSHAGNSAFVSSALLEVDDGEGILTISYELAAGGSDVLQSLGPVLDESDDDLLVGLCAVVATSDDASNTLVAIGPSEAGPAHAVTPAFGALVETSSTMAGLADAG